jgi:PilZ domain-containing protein
MSAKHTRRHHRAACTGPVRLSWEDASGHPAYAQGKCIDISEGGLKIEIPCPIPLRGYVSWRADRIGLAGSASVRYVLRCGAKYTVGLELSQSIPSAALPGPLPALAA